MKKLALISLVSLSACASILQGGEQKVSLRLDPDQAGKCTITSRNGSQTVSVPSEVTIERSYYPTDIDCTADSGENGKARVYSDVSALGYTGAVAGLGVGAVVDSSTGDAFDYPNQIVVKLGATTEIGKNSMNSNVDFK